MSVLLLYDIMAVQKLGTGGLVRAYGGGVINALKNATLVERKDAF